MKNRIQLAVNTIRIASRFLAGAAVLLSAIGGRADVAPSLDVAGVRMTMLGKANDRHTYYSDGTTLLLRDGSLLYVMARRHRPLAGQQEGWHSHYIPADLAFSVSHDRGESWSMDDTLLRSDARTLGSPGLVRLGTGEIGLCYNKIVGDLAATKMFRFSSDEGKTWSDEIPIGPIDGYWTSAHDRLIILGDGRLLLPLHNKEVLVPERMVTRVARSDDHGRTWKVSAQRLNVEDRMPEFVKKFGDTRGTGFWESAIVERADRSLLMIGRTRAGYLYRCFSRDRGETWTEPQRTSLVSPEAPAQLRRFPDSNDLLIVWNSGSINPHHFALGERLTLSTAISTDGGETWKWRRDLVSATPSSVRPFGACYPSVRFQGGFAFIGYCYRTGAQENMRGTEYLARVPLVWLYAERDTHNSELVGTVEKIPDPVKATPAKNVRPAG